MFWESRANFKGSFMLKLFILSSLIFVSFSGYAEERIDLGLADCVEQFNPSFGESRKLKLSNVMAYVESGPRRDYFRVGTSSVPFKRFEMRGNEIVSSSRRDSIMGDNPLGQLGHRRPVNSYSVFHQLVIDQRRILMTSQWVYTNGEVLSSSSICTFKTPQDVQQIFEDISSISGDDRH